MRQTCVQGTGCATDEAIRISDSGVFLVGWFVHTDTGVREVQLASFKGRRITAPYPPTVVRRRDVTQSLESEFAPPNHHNGFLLYVPIDGLSVDETDWHLEYHLDCGAVARIPFELGPAQAPLSGIKYVLSRIELPLVDLAEAFANTVGHCVETLLAERQSRKVNTAISTFGPTKAKPAVSVIVPLYGRLDFLRFQIASFSNDPDFTGESAIAEIIYVLDDPPQETAFLTLCRDVYGTYGVPFRAVALSRNSGFSGANNAGARIAKGEFLLLLNSDVMPISARWLTELVATHRGLTDCGALGCRLLYEGGSIQHAGMTFRRSELIKGAWENGHQFKGYPVGFDPVEEPTEVPAVTAACLLVRRSIYEMTGGLTEDYVIADFEDSDFCLKLRNQGFKIWYTPGVELHHLERQSVNKTGEADWRLMLTLFNMWKHAQCWGSAIEGLVADGETKH